MEGETPRSLIRGVLQTGQATRSSPRRRQTPSTSTRLSRSVTQPSHQPISSGKISRSVKRPARGSLTSEAKKRRSVTSTPSETITPRTNIRAYLAAVDTKTPAKPLETRTSHQRLSRSAISDRQVQKLIASESRSQRTSPRTKSLSQSFPTPRESITPREAIKIYLNTADTVPQTRRSMPKRSNIRYADTGDSQEESSEEKQDDSESAAGDDEQSQDDERKPESGEESGEFEEERVESGVEVVHSGDEKGQSGNESGEYGDEKVEARDGRGKSGDQYSQEEDMQNDPLEHGNEFHASPQHEKQHELENTRIEHEDKYESSHEATTDSSQDEQEVSGVERREQDSSQEETSSQDEQAAVNQSRMQGSLEGGESSHENAVSGVKNRSGHSRSVEWGKLRTPVLPDTTTVKATPIVLGKPPIPVQQKKARSSKDHPSCQKGKTPYEPLEYRKETGVPGENVRCLDRTAITCVKLSDIRKASGKGNQAKKPKRKGNSVLRLPSSLVNGIFRHFSALRVSKDALDAVQVGGPVKIISHGSVLPQEKTDWKIGNTFKLSDAFFEHIATDLTSYCKHAGRKTIEESDAELLMRRQGLVKSRESFHALIEKYLPMEYRQEIIPTAKSGNKVVPKAKT